MGFVAQGRGSSTILFSTLVARFFGCVGYLPYHFLVVEGGQVGIFAMTYGSSEGGHDRVGARIFGVNRYSSGLIAIVGSKAKGGLAIGHCSYIYGTFRVFRYVTYGTIVRRLAAGL